jgi:hypothetical protein
MGYFKLIKRRKINLIEITKLIVIVLIEIFSLENKNGLKWVNRRRNFLKKHLVFLKLWPKQLKIN